MAVQYEEPRVSISTRAQVVFPSDEYQHLHTHPNISPMEEENRYGSVPLSKKHTGRAIAYAVTTLVAFALTITTLFALQQPGHNLFTTAELGCGNSPEQAIAKGCLFDVTSFTWLPGPCFDPQIPHDFLATSDWRWYRDAGGQEEVAVSLATTGRLDNLFVSMRYHVAHCAFMWSKLHRAMATGGMIDSYVGSLEHTEHCAKMILAVVNEGQDAVGLNTVIRLKYATCSNPL